MEESFRRSNFLELAEKRLESQNAIFTSLDEKAWQNVNISSIIVGLAVTLNLDAVLHPGAKASIPPIIFLSLALVAYLYSFIKALQARLPTSFKSFKYPLEMSWDEATYALNEHDDDSYYAYLIASYTDALAANTPVIEEKTRQVRNSTVALGFTVSFLIMAAITAALV